jgi:hypothetical protein
MADYGFPDPKGIFNERLGVAVVPASISYRNGKKLIKLDLLNELEIHFTILPISDKDWHTSRF